MFMPRVAQKQAQILVTTLLVLMIIAVIVVGVVSLASKDVAQTISNQQYEQLYNASEEAIFQVIEKYGQSAVSLSELQSVDYPTECAADLINGGYRCEFINPTTDVSILQVADRATVTDYELGKDDNIVLQLSGYTGEIYLNWRGDAALEFALLYSDGGQIKYIGDLYDKSGQVDAAGNDPILDPPPSNHAFPFAEVTPGLPTNIHFRIDGIVGLPVSAVPLALSVTARIRATGSTIGLDISGSTGLPNQVREFIATSYSPGSTLNVVAKVKAQIPLYPQTLPLFQYAFGVDGAVAKN
jgi:hypothetical protein